MQTVRRSLIPASAEMSAVRIIGALSGIHLWNALVSLFGPMKWFDSDGLKYVNQINPRVWGLMFLFAGVSLTAIIFRPVSSNWGKRFLAAGMLLTLSQALLVGLTFFDDEPTAAARGVGVWGGLAALHAACILSPRRLHTK